MKKDSFLKLIIISFIGIVVLWFAKELLFPSNYLGINISGNYGGEHMYMSGNYGFGAGTFSVLLIFLIKVLIVLFVVALIVGLIMVAKNYIFTPQNMEAYKSGSTPVEQPRKTCDICGKPLDNNWKVCPYCGTEAK
ncbi:zinc ribbon domain-containing protein [Anaerocolumna chitinilytica]|uniref:Putative zinc-ribbon domain-containing protein n=1 Tax=Anaerocolumna chitinilytica TaxID=1727145 RepID=A0A7I8DJE0_9FIRM|nr:zinc ribbon domain-containing protein [Anaerocolumna chitinilytica]BCJ98442.1 hypothetical protein bsdcttw_14830 [Anaerocolumna chitinilytica]